MNIDLDGEELQANVVVVGDLKLEAILGLIFSESTGPACIDLGRKCYYTLRMEDGLYHSWKGVKQHQTQCLSAANYPQ